MVDIIFHPEAQAEYEDALGWYQNRSRRAASGFEAEVQRLLNLIQINPNSYPAYNDEHRFAILRRFPFTLIFQAQHAHIFIIAVAHAGRRPGYWQGRA